MPQLHSTLLHIMKYGGTPKEYKLLQNKHRCKAVTKINCVRKIHLQPI